MMTDRVLHTLKPVYSSDSRVLILGTMPSPKSRETGFYYGHPQNRMWRVLAEVFGDKLPSSNEEKAEFLNRHHIAMWDVLAECDIKGAQDSSIKNPVANDINIILKNSSVKKIFTAGKTAGKLYRKYCLENTGREAVELPSTSPANCACGFEKLVEAYNILCEYCE